MQKLKKTTYLSLLVLVMAAVFAISPFSSTTSYAATTWAGHTTDWSNVRTAPSASSTRITTYSPDTNVTVYASVSGQTVNPGNSIWYRVSGLSSAARFIYSGLVARGSVSNGGGNPPSTGKAIIVSLSKQWIYVYQNGKELKNGPATTGQPALPTPTGTYHIFQKLHPTTFISGWPKSSPYYYPPTHITYALQWRAGGFYLHDSYWRSVFGPGTNVWHYDPVGGWLTGTHGCVTMPFSMIQWIYTWADIGTTVIIKN